MTVGGWLQIAFYSVVLLLITKPLGMYVLKVYDGSLTWLRPVERVLYRAAGVDPAEDQHWTRYTASMLIFSAVSMLLTYVVLRLQHLLPLNPQDFAAVPDRQAFETAASFTTNTNWQSYSGESTMSYLSQMTQLAFHNFMSAAVGVSVAVAFARGIVRRSAGRLGHFWADLVRGTLYLFLPLSALLALLFVQQGVIQNFAHYVTVTTGADSGRAIFSPSRWSRRPRAPSSPNRHRRTAAPPDEIAPRLTGSGPSDEGGEGPRQPPGGVRVPSEK